MYHLKSHIRSICTIFCFIAFTGASYAKTYHVDSQVKFDSVNQLKLQAGDKILLKKGSSFKGMLTPQGTGSKAAPIIISSYGNGPKPRIHAEGKHQAGLLLKDPSFIQVSGLEITNSDGSKKDQGSLFGIYALAQSEEKTYEHVYINDCYIHTVNGNVAGKNRGGIHVHMKKLKNSKFDNLRITNNKIENVGGVGIGNRSTCAGVDFKGDKTVTKNLWTKVYVAGNFVDHTGRNNIIARVSKDAIYEFNTLANSSRYDTGHSIFCFDTVGIKIQYNEAYGNVGHEGKDRGGFDADYNCDETYIQYNYSHDNEWFCGIMKKPNRNVVIRYNISENDRQGIYFYGFNGSKDLKNLHVYNNTHFIGKHLKKAVVFPEGRLPLESRFENNIFYFEGKGKWGKHVKGKSTKFHNNLYYGIEPHPSDKSPILLDPKFLSPGKAGQHVDWKTFKEFKGYQLKSSSPALKAGSPIKNNGEIDFFKNRINSKPDLGATGRGR